MILRSAPEFKTRMRPFEAALLICYLREQSASEPSDYLSGFLQYVASLCLEEYGLERNFSPIVNAHQLEQAEACLADLREHGEPGFMR